MGSYKSLALELQGIDITVTAHYSGTTQWARTVRTGRGTCWTGGNGNGLYDNHTNLLM
jgi:hypothetical protein